MTEKTKQNPPRPRIVVPAEFAQKILANSRVPCDRCGKQIKDSVIITEAGELIDRKCWKVGEKAVNIIHRRETKNGSVCKMRT